MIPVSAHSGTTTTTNNNSNNNNNSDQKLPPAATSLNLDTLIETMNKKSQFQNAHLQETLYFRLITAFPLKVKEL